MQKCIVFAVVGLLGLLAFTVLAQTPAPAPAKTSFTFEKMHDTYEVQRDGRYALTSERTIRFNTEQAARQNSQVPIPVSEGEESLEILEAYTTRQNGERVDVKKEAIFTQAAPVAVNAPMFNSQKLRIVVFPDVASNTTVSFKYRLTRREAAFPGQFSLFQPFATTESIADASVTVTAPSDLTLNLWQQGLAVAEDKTADGKRSITWRYRNLTPRTPEAFEVADRDAAPGFAVSTFSDWADLGKAYEARAAVKAAVTPAIITLAAELTRGAADKREEVRKIYEWSIRNVRYVALHFGSGALVPRPVETILDTKYGDCKDYTTLMQALLAARGVESSALIINLGQQTYKLPSVASVQAFDHAILHVPEFNLFLDGTSSYTRFGTIPTILQGKQGLSTKSGKLVKLPAPSAEVDTYTLTTKLTLNAEGGANAETKIIAGGRFDNAFRSQLSGVPPNSLPRVVAETLTSTQQRGSGALTFTDPADLSKSMEVNATYQLEDAVYFQSPGAITLPVGFNLFSIGSMSTGTRVKNRQTAFKCGSDAYAENYELVIPPEFKVLAIPKGTNFESKTLRFSSTYQQTGNAVKAVRTAKRSRPEAVCQPGDWAEFELFRTAILRDSKAQILIQ